MSKIPDEAVHLHEAGRAAGSAGDAAAALELFHQAYELAPDWPYPAYDMAFTYLLNDYLEEAEHWYAHVDKLAPRGFFTSKASLDMIRRERRGELFDGFSKAYALLEWEPPASRRPALEAITKQFPTFARAWKDLASLLDDDDERLAALERGLACEPDDETYCVLVVNKSFILRNRGDVSSADKLIADLMKDPRCTTAAASLLGSLA